MGVVTPLRFQNGQIKEVATLLYGCRDPHVRESRSVFVGGDAEDGAVDGVEAGRSGVGGEQGTPAERRGYNLQNFEGFYLKVWP